MGVMSAETLLEVRMRAEPAGLKSLRSLVEAAAIKAGCEKDVASQIGIAVNEACMNVIQHAFRGEASGEMVIRVSAHAAVLVCRIEDSAPLVDLDAIRPRPLDDIRPGGLGTHFMAELMDECHYGHLESRDGNYVEKTKKIS